MEYNESAALEPGYAIHLFHEPALALLLLALPIPAKHNSVKKEPSFTCYYNHRPLSAVPLKIIHK